MEHLAAGGGGVPAGRWAPDGAAGLRLRLARGGGARLCRFHRRGTGHAASPTRSPPAASPRYRFPATAFTSGEPAAAARREASHVCCCRCGSPAARIDGMVSLEADCTAAIGPVRLARVGPGRSSPSSAAPYLGALPPSRARWPSRTRTCPWWALHGACSSRCCASSPSRTRRCSSPAPPARASRGWPAGATAARGAQGPLRGPGSRDGPRGAADGGALRLERGAFTGAVRTRRRRGARRGGHALHRRDRQALLKAQAGLLHVLEERRYRPLGDGGERAASPTSASSSARTRTCASRCRPAASARTLLPDQRPARAAAAAGRAARRARGLGALHAAPPPPGPARRAGAALARGARLLLAHALARQPAAARQHRPPRLHAGPGGAGRRRAELELREPHIAQALAYDGGAQAPPLVEALSQAARAFVLEARRREASARHRSRREAFGASCWPRRCGGGGGRRPSGWWGGSHW